MDASLALTQVSSTAIFVWAMQRLKSWDKFVWLQENGQIWAKRIVSVIGAFFIHGAINYTWDPTFDANGNRHLSLAIPATSIILLSLWHTFGQYVIQEAWYQAFYNRFHMAGSGLPAPARKV